MSTPKNARCKYPHRIGVRVDDELYVKIQNGAIMCDLSPSEFFRQMLKKRRPISWQKIAVVPPELPGLIDKYREVGNEFNNLAHYFNAGGTLDVDSGNRLTVALDQLKSLSGEVQAMTRNFQEKVHAYLSKNP
jgi:hypothetical protein